MQNLPWRIDLWDQHVILDTEGNTVAYCINREMAEAICALVNARGKA